MLQEVSPTILKSTSPAETDGNFFCNSGRQRPKSKE